MEKSEFRMLSTHYFLRGKSIKETEKKLAKYYKESAPSHGMVHKSFTEFHCSRISTSNAEHPGRPKEVTSQEIVDKTHDIVLNHRRLNVRDISETVHISVGRVWHILHECLGMRKLPTRWVPRFLTADHKRARVVASKQCFGIFQRNSKEFLRRHVTVDERWIHHHMPETKTQSKMWTGPGESAPKKAKTVQSAVKVMATISWDSHGIILIDYLQKGKNITGEYYASLLD